MKNFIKITSILLVALVLCLTSSIRSINSYFNDKDILSTEFVFGTIETEIIEENDTKTIVAGERFKKVVKIKNIGQSPCFVRVRVLISPEKYTDELNLDINISDWDYKDGFYYYKTILKPNEETSPLFTRLFIPQSLKAGDIFDINIYSESIQPFVYENGSIIEDYLSIFEKI